MPGLEGDLEEWQTQEVNVTRGEAEGDIEGDLEEWQTQEVNVTRGEAEGDIDLEGLHSSRSPEGLGIICFIIPDSSTFSCTY